MCFHQPHRAVVLSVDGSKQQVPISVSWQNKESLAGFSEILAINLNLYLVIYPAPLLLSSSQFIPAGFEH